MRSKILLFLSDPSCGILLYQSKWTKTEGTGGLVEFFFVVSSFCYSPTQYGNWRTKKAGRVLETILDPGGVRRKLDHRGSLTSGIRPVLQASVSLSSRGASLWDEELGTQNAPDRQIKGRSTNWMVHWFTCLSCSPKLSMWSWLRLQSQL